MTIYKTKALCTMFRPPCTGLLDGGKKLLHSEDMRISKKAHTRGNTKPMMLKPGRQRVIQPNILTELNKKIIRQKMKNEEQPSGKGGPLESCLKVVYHIDLDNQMYPMNIQARSESDVTMQANGQQQRPGTLT